MSTTAPERLELPIEGMTCASCAMRIEKRLNKLEGVTASVNYSTEKAKVTYTGDVTPADLVAAVDSLRRTPRRRPSLHPRSSG